MTFSQSAHWNRRDFLKLAPLVFAGSLTHSLAAGIERLGADSNIILIVMDALSAKHMSLYGYRRDTTPNINRFADRAHVYVNHYSAGNFTTPGTASLLTGLYPWTHRAFNQGGLIKRDLTLSNYFSLLGDRYYRFAFSQNPYPDRILAQFIDDLDRFLPLTSYSLRGNKLFSDKVGKDRYLASAAFEEFLFPLSADVTGSSLFGYIYKSFAVDTFLKNQKHTGYPKGTPTVEGYTPYLNEDIYAGVYREIQRLEGQPRPFFSYFHLFSPHFPYKPGRRYYELFENDGVTSLAKPKFPFGFKMSDEEVDSKRLLYDQQIAHVDAEFGRLIELLEQDGILENSTLILTSDHGEIFERGFYGHGGPIMYEPVISIPLLIHTPGQTEGSVVHTPSCNIDVLPTILHIAGQTWSNAVDGQVLPGFGGEQDDNRAIFSMYAGENSVFRPIGKASIAMRKGKYKLIAYLGYYEGRIVYEFYDLQEDPEEIRDLVSGNPVELKLMKAELLEKLAAADRPYNPD